MFAPAFFAVLLQRYLASEVTMGAVKRDRRQASIPNVLTGSSELSVGAPIGQGSSG